MRLLLASFIVLLALAFRPEVTQAQAVTSGEVAKALVCQCGCNSVLANCLHQECHSREAMIAAINQQIAAGKSAQAIIASFVAQYGEQVLSAPTKEGFNLSAWILPFLALAAGAAVLYLVLRNWVLRGQAPVVVTEEDQEADTSYRQRVEKELKEFQGGF